MERTKKKYLKINEVSKLYGIGADSLRYYEEIGLLSPARGENGYRCYGPRELMLLNIVCEYRNMNLSLTQIRDMLNTRSVRGNLEVLYQERERIDSEIARLQHKKAILSSKIENSLLFLGDLGDLRIHRKRLPAFKCLHITDEHVRPDNIDFYITRYLRESRTNLDELTGRYDLYRLDAGEVAEDGFCRTREVLIINNAMSAKPDFVLPGGEYLVIGTSEAVPRTKKLADELLSYASAHGIPLAGDVFVLVVFDFYDTSLPNEYLSLVICRIADQS